MKKAITLFIIISFTLFIIISFFFSCDNQITNIDLKNIEDECELLDAVDILFSKAMEYHYKYGEDVDEMPVDIQEKIEEIFEKIGDVDVDKFDYKKLQLCPNFEEINKKSIKLTRFDKRYDT